MSFGTLGAAIVHTGVVDKPNLLRVLAAIKDKPLDQISDEEKEAVMARVDRADHEVVEVARFTSAI